MGENWWTIIIELIFVVLVLTAMFVFFFRKKSVKLMLMYTLTYLVYVAAVIADRYVDGGLPILRAVVALFTFFLTVALVVVYAADIKVIFFDITKKTDRIQEGVHVTDEEMRHAIDEIIKACQSMSKTRTGALIVVAPTSVPTHTLETGTRLNALVSAYLLETIFFNNTPLHDGAVFIKGNQILAAGCFLPLSQTNRVSKQLGTRHRAGIGITEESDMLTIIVSEETGIISVANHGELRRFVTTDRLRDVLRETLNIAQPTHHRG